MVGSMAGFAIEDMLIKYLALEIPTGQFLMLIGGCGGVVFCGDGPSAGPAGAVG